MGAAAFFKDVHCALLIGPEASADPGDLELRGPLGIAPNWGEGLGPLYP